jgi:pimeloyl-ACP methyl ester carboxylesterase
MSSQPSIHSVPFASLGRAIAELQGDTKLRVDCNGTPVQIQASRRRNRRLVVLFHGAVKPDRRHLVTEFNTPKLAKLIDANVVAVTDPSLERSATLTAAWYLGHEGFPAQRLLAKLFRQIQDRLKIERPVYVGGSAGGFAALYYSWVNPGSVAIAVNPQTSLSRHRTAHQLAYRNACWPSLEAGAGLGTVVHEDLSVLYRKKVPNAVVYLQNSMDPYHLRNHLAPFVGAIRPADLAKIVTDVRFWGTVGHSNSIPRQAWFDWARAALDATSISAVDLLTAHAQQASTSSPAPERLQDTDLGLARRLAELARRELAAEEPS